MARVVLTCAGRGRHVMPDMLRQIVYPSFVVVLIASVWALGWEKAHNDATEQGLDAAPGAYNAWMLEEYADRQDESFGPVSATSYDYE